MKKVILSEEQIKRLMDKLIVNEQVSSILPDNSKRIGSTNQNGKYKLCDFFVIKEGDRWFLEQENGGRIEIPKLSDITGTIKMSNNEPHLIPNPLISNGFKAGQIVGYESTESECWKYVSAPRKTWFVYVDPDYKGLVGDKMNGTEEMKSYVEIPVFCGLDYHNDSTNPTRFSAGKLVDEKEGQVIQMGETYTENFKFTFMKGLGGKMIGGGNDKKPIPPPPPPPPTPPQSVNFTVDFGNNFESGKYDLDMNYLKNINDKIDQIIDFITGKKLKNFKLVITPGESQVPNQHPFEKSGSLARRRGEELKNYLRNQIKNALQIDPPIDVEEPVIGTTKWDSKLGKNNEIYKKEQFVRVSVVINA
jgi:hypothetical protein